MPGSIEQSLTTLANSFTPKVIQGGPLDCTIQLIAPPNNPMTIDDLITETVLKNGTVDVLWQTKDVRFVDDVITNTNVEGGMPVTNLLNLNAATTFGRISVPGLPGLPNVPVPGVPGILGALKGTIPIPVLETVTKTFNINTQVKWTIRDENGNIVTDVKWGLPLGILNTGGEIALPLDQSFFVLIISFPPLFTELTNNTVPNVVVKRTIQASIRLDAAGISTGWIDLPPADLFLPVIPVPTIAMFFEHQNFRGMSLILIPSDSPLDPVALNVIDAALKTLNGLLGPVQAVANFLSFFINEFGTIQNALAASTRITFRRVNEISNLRNVELEPASLSDWNGTVASDEFSSVLMIGPPRRQLKCFNDTSFDDGQGQINLTIGPELLVECRDLGGSAPSSQPAGRLTIVKSPSGWNWSLARYINKFSDEISSVKFDWAL